jgi:hypothetical protein
LKPLWKVSRNNRASWVASSFCSSRNIRLLFMCFTSQPWE